MRVLGPDESYRDTATTRLAITVGHYPSMNRTLGIVSIITTWLAIAYAGPAKQNQWRANSDKYVNDPRNHESLIKACGHDIKAEIDWPTYPFEKYYNEKDDILREVGATCIEVFSDLRYFCGSTDENRKAYVAPAKKITKLVCHYKDCEKLPQVDPKKKQGGPGFEWKLSKDGTKLEHWSCEKSSISSLYNTRWSLEQLF